MLEKAEDISRQSRIFALESGKVRECCSIIWTASSLFACLCMLCLSCSHGRSDFKVTDESRAIITIWLAWVRTVFERIDENAKTRSSAAADARECWEYVQMDKDDQTARERNLESTSSIRNRPCIGSTVVVRAISSISSAGKQNCTT
jgi:hypothetical protein